MSVIMWRQVRQIRKGGFNRGGTDVVSCLPGWTVT
jgi:hypothetical protein